MWVGLPAHTVVPLAGKRICRGNRKRRKLGMAAPYLIYVVSVELHCAASLLRFPHHRDGYHTLLS
jgi:hypothetical protein